LIPLTADLDTLMRRYAATPSPAVREEIIERHQGLVRTLARKFVRPGVPVEDLMQVAWLGLIRAFDRFDTSLNVQFSTYAVVCMTGEIKRYFRDSTWALKVPRELQSLASRVPMKRDELEAQLQRAPRLLELAEALEVSEETIVEAMEAYRSYQPDDLDRPHVDAGGESGATLADRVGGCDPALQAVTDRAPMAAALAMLEERDELVLRRRFFEGQTQAQVADELQVSQMQVSRLERRAIGKLRQVLQRQA
jgi:RNA polymerase sigma-B factor